MSEADLPFSERISTISTHEQVLQGSHIGRAKFRLKCTCGWRSDIKGRLSACQRQWREHKQQVALGEAREVA